MFYLLSLVMTCAILFWIVYAKGFDIHLPRLYALDAIFSGSGVKTIIDTGWILSNPHLAAPLTSSLVDYPASDNLSFLIVKCLSFFSSNYALVMNLFFFLTFPLTTLFSLFVFRQLNLRPAFALVASLLFTFLPYHLMRGEGHLFLTTLYVIPLYVLMMFSVFNNTKITPLKSFFYLLACIVTASSGIYYAFFACYFLLLCGLLASYSLRTWKPLIKPVIFIGIIMAVIIASVSPSLIASAKQGKNTELGVRVARESELAGLKIAQLLLPVDMHRMHPLKVLKQNYNNTAPLVNENSTSTLGIIGSIGFVILLLLLLAREKIQSDTWYLLSRLNISGVLLGTIGGFSTLYAYLISPSIRSYNRISVFIAFFALLAFFYLLQEGLQKRNAKKITTLGVLVFILLVGLLDQVGNEHNPDYQLIAQQYRSDEKFVASIEKILPKDSMVFQLPVAGFPENPPVYHMTDYQLFRGYLHSHTLHWSYGAVRGRQVIKWQTSVMKKPVKEMLNALSVAGFSGIYIDRNGYEDGGKNLETQLISLLKQKPLISDDKSLVFFDMRNYANQFKHSMSREQWAKNSDNLHRELMLEARWYDGFHHHESEVIDDSRWTRHNNAVIRVVNYDTQPLTVHLSFILKTASANDEHIKISSDLLNEDFLVNAKGKQVNKTFTLSPGPHLLYLTTQADGVELPSDGRYVFFRVEKMRVN
jgi:phosphoglycerol transferase